MASMQFWRIRLSLMRYVCFSISPPVLICFRNREFTHRRCFTSNAPLMPPGLVFAEPVCGLGYLASVAAVKSVAIHRSAPVCCLTLPASHRARFPSLFRQHPGLGNRQDASLCGPQNFLQIALCCCRSSSSLFVIRTPQLPLGTKR